MKWKKEEPGDYWSTDNRFHIFKDHRVWLLFDTMAHQRRTGFSLKMCKQQAEKIVEEEEKMRKGEKYMQENILGAYKDLQITTRESPRL